MEVDDLERGNLGVVDGLEVEPTQHASTGTRAARTPQGCRVSMLGRRVPPRLAAVDAEVQVLDPLPPTPGSRLLALGAATPPSAAGQEDARQMDSPLERPGEASPDSWWG